MLLARNNALMLRSLSGRQIHGSKDPTNSIKVQKEQRYKVKKNPEKQTTQNTAKPAFVQMNRRFYLISRDKNLVISVFSSLFI